MGVLPGQLFKFYDERRYAEAFLNPGTIRLRTLDYFKRTEDATRADESEGQGSLKVQDQDLNVLSLPSGKISSKAGELDWGVVSGDPMLIFCMSLPGVDLKALAAKWPHVIQIHSPESFKKDFETGVAASTPKGATLLRVEYIAVQYDKGKAVLKMPDFGQSAHLAYSQKPPIFSNECEFRFVAIYDAIGFPEDLDFIDLKLKSPASYARHADA